MGIYTKADITITFKKPVPFELTKLNTFLKDYVEEGSHIEAKEIEMHDEYLNFTLDSGRSKNLEWQVDKTLEFFKEKYSSDIECFDSDAYTQHSTSTFYVEEF